MLSQDRIGSARGPNVDYEILDEALTIDKERYDQETSPTNRGNEDLWGPNSGNFVPFHHGYHYASSMPYSQTQKWLLDFAGYYETEAGLQIFSIWNRTVKLQMELIPAYYARDIKLYTLINNETSCYRKRCDPCNYPGLAQFHFAVHWLPGEHSRQSKDLTGFLKEKLKVRDSNSEFRVPNT